MGEQTGDRLKKVVERLYDGNKSAMARDFNRTPQSFTTYFNNKSEPGSGFLRELLYKGININWLLTGEGPMLLKELTRTNESDIHYKTSEPKVNKLIQLIVSRLEAVDFSIEKKAEILKDTLREIAIEQNQHFVSSELNSSEDE